MSTSLQTEPILARAHNHLRQGEYSIAIALLRSLTAQGVTEPRVLETLGVAYSLAGSHGLAISLLKQTIEDAPQRVSSYVNLGAQLTRHEAHSQAIACLLQALQITRDSAEVYLSLGVAYQETQDWAHAESAFRSAMQLNPACVSAYFHLAQVCVQTNNQSDAVACLRHVLKLEPTHSQARRTLDELTSEKSEPPRRSTVTVMSPHPMRQRRLTHDELAEIQQLAVDLESRCQQLMNWFNGVGDEVLSLLQTTVAEVSQ
jgi:Flp pilus assembly protein TadD